MRALPPSRLWLLPAITALALATAASPAAAKCKKHSGTLASSGGDVVWHKGSTLYGCQGENSSSFPQEKLGTWASGTKVKLGYGFVAWTVPGGTGSKRYDRVHATIIAGGKGWPHWLRNEKAVPAGASTPARDARVQTLLTRLAAFAWVTTEGDVVMAVQDPPKAPEPIGDLTEALKAQKSTLLVGSWPGGSAADLAESAKFGYKQAQYACTGTGDEYTLTVTPPGKTDRVGAKWFDTSQYLDCP